LTYERVLVLLPPSILTRAQADTFKGNIWENLEHLMRHHYVREGTEAPSSRQELDWEPWYCDEAVADWVGDYLSAPSVRAWIQGHDRLGATIEVPVFKAADLPPVFALPAVITPDGTRHEIHPDQNDRFVRRHVSENSDALAVLSWGLTPELTY